MRRLLLSGLVVAASWLWPAHACAEGPAVQDQLMRRAMVDRGLQYLFSIQKEGAVGEQRPRAVTSLFVLACLSSGITPSHPQHGARVKAAYQWLARSSSASFLGGQEEPNADHAVAALMLTELLGQLPDRKENLDLYERIEGAGSHSLAIQDKGVGAAYFGGWRPNSTTRTNSRVLTAWFLYSLRAGELRGLSAPKSNVSRAVEFVEASQRAGQTKDKDQRGGFSVDAEGLAVSSASGAGVAIMAIYGSDLQRAADARDWLVRHPPRWYGPNFFETHFFAVRGLYRLRDLDDSRSLKPYFDRLAQMLRERQEPDGSVPFPPGHGGPIVAMGKGYSTAMAILILNVDRGLLPIDQPCARVTPDAGAP